MSGRKDLGGFCERFRSDNLIATPTFKKRGKVYQIRRKHYRKGRGWYKLLKATYKTYEKG